MYTRPVRVSKEISKDEAKSLLVEARVVNLSQSRVLDVYQNCGGTLYRVFSLEIPNDFEEPDDLLEYARSHIPDEIYF